MTLPIAPRPHDPHLSPSIQRSLADKAAAYELKFLIAADLALRVQHWAARAMQLDAHINPALGSYQTTTLYLDTATLDVFHRNPGFRKRKFRLRRYGSDQRLFLERKTRSGTRVEKRRSDVPLHDLSNLASRLAIATWPGQWFLQKTAETHLHPACRISYDRTAYVILTESGPLRLTLDRNIRGLAGSTWDLAPIANLGRSILPDQVVCEFKFRHHLPRLFKDLITRLNLTPGGVSKYRQIMTATSVPEGPAYV